MALFVPLEASCKKAVTQAAQERNANYKKNKMPSSFSNLINKRKAKVYVSQPQVRSKSRKQPIQEDNSKCQRQHAWKRVKPVKVNCSDQYSDQPERANVRTTNDVDPIW